MDNKTILLNLEQQLNAHLMQCMNNGVAANLDDIVESVSALEKINNILRPNSISMSAVTPPTAEEYSSTIAMDTNNNSEPEPQPKFKFADGYVVRGREDRMGPPPAKGHQSKTAPRPTAQSTTTKSNSNQPKQQPPQSHNQIVSGGSNNKTMAQLDAPSTTYNMPTPTVDGHNATTQPQDLWAEDIIDQVFPQPPTTHPNKSIDIPEQYPQITRQDLQKPYAVPNSQGLTKDEARQQLENNNQQQRHSEPAIVPETIPSAEMLNQIVQHQQQAEYEQQLQYLRQRYNAQPVPNQQQQQSNQGFNDFHQAVQPEVQQPQSYLLPHQVEQVYQLESMLGRALLPHEVQQMIVIANDPGPYSVQGRLSVGQFPLSGQPVSDALPMIMQQLFNGLM